MKRSTFVLPAVALALLLASPSWAGDREANDQAPKVIGLLFDAEWCGTCKVLVPKLDAVKPQFQGQPILFTRFDKTDEFAQEQSRRFADWVGLTEIYEANEGRTGFMLLIDPSTNEVLGRLTANLDEQELAATIQDALEQAVADG